VNLGKSFLTGPTARAGAKHSDYLISFLKENSSLIGGTDSQIGSLKVAADYTNPDGVLSFVELNQEINGIPVFRGEVKAGFTADGELIRVINNFAPGLDYNSLSTDFGDPASAVKAAAENIKYQLREGDTVANTAVSNDLKVNFSDRARRRTLSLARPHLGTCKCLLRDRRRRDRDRPVAEEHHERSDTARNL
jgi:Zn-dependent metalloprotease